MVGEHLHARGRNVEVLLAFRDGASLALIAPTPGLFLADVRLEAGTDGIVRCRIAGEPAAFVEAAPGLWLNVVTLASMWPSLLSELARAVGPDRIARFVEARAIVQEMQADSLKSLILEHQIHAKDLHVLGEHGPARIEPITPASGTSFSLKFPNGDLALAYTTDRYRAAHSLVHPLRRADDLATITWKGSRVALDEKTPWRDDDLVEVLLVAKESSDVDPAKALPLLEATSEENKEPGDDPRRELLSEIANLHGITLRKLRRFDEAFARFDHGLSLVRGRGLRTEGGLHYNRGFARLQSTMRSTTPTGGRGDGAQMFFSQFEIDERHRAAWLACRYDFMRALELDKTDAIAAEQLGVVEKVLALLDHNAGGGSKGPPPSPRGGPSSSARGNASPPATASKPDRSWIVSILLVVGLMGFAEVMRQREQRRPSRDTAATLPSAPSRPDPERDAWRASERLRVQLYASRDPSIIAPPIGSEPCPLEIALPSPVPPREGIAPHLARSIGDGELYGTEYFDATMRVYFRRFMPGAEAFPVDRAGIGPVAGTGALRARTWGRDSVQLTLAITSWRDPSFDSPDGIGPFTSGAITGRLLVWSYADRRVVCAADVEATNTPHLTIVRVADDPLGRPTFRDSDDPLNRARIDLVEQALRNGIPMLRATVTGGPALGDASRDDAH